MHGCASDSIDGTSLSLYRVQLQNDLHTFVSQFIVIYNHTLQASRHYNLRMPTDAYGQVHAGSIGLFDCDDDYEDTARRLAKKQQRNAKRRARREKRRATKRRTQEPCPKFSDAREDENQGEAKGCARFAALRFFSLFYRIKNPTRLVTHRKVTGIWKFKDRMRYRELADTTPTLEDDIERVFPMDLPIDELLNPEPSPWLEEVGNVRVRSKKEGGWDVVPLSLLDGARRRERGEGVWASRLFI